MATPDRAGAGLTEAQLAKMDQAVAYGYWDSASVATEDVRRLVAAVRALTREKANLHDAINGLAAELARARDEARRATARAERLAAALRLAVAWLPIEKMVRDADWREQLHTIRAALAAPGAGEKEGGA